jgi:hypothetical protein
MELPRSLSNGLRKTFGVAPFCATNPCLKDIHKGSKGLKPEVRKQARVSVPDSMDVSRRWKVGPLVQALAKKATVKGDGLETILHIHGLKKCNHKFGNTFGLKVGDPSCW